MATQEQTGQDRDWYSISVSSLKRGMTLIGLVLAAISSALIYQQWEQHTRRDRAASAIESASSLAASLEDREDYDRIFIEHRTAWADLEDAKAEFAAERYGPALLRARESLRELDSIFDVGQDNSKRESRFLSVQGGVEYRRGERGSWIRARANNSLNPGDWIKTSANGTAEIRFSDGSTYILRRDTMVHLGSLTNSESETEQVDIHFGWVDLNLAEQSSSKVKTPESEATFQEGAEGAISYDRDLGAEFRTYEGNAEVVSASGQTQQMSAFQEVEQRGGRLSAPTSMPAAPQLNKPTDEQEIDFGAQKEMRLSWQPIRGTPRYALNVSRSRIFAANVIEDDQRAKTSAKLGIRGEGTFYWRVAAYDKSGTRGAWSETRSFRIATLRGVGDKDTTPPVLVIDEVQPFGSQVRVTGSTEPGAIVQINAEPVAVKGDGSFSETIQMAQGSAFIKIVATDAANNSTEVKRRVAR